MMINIDRHTREIAELEAKVAALEAEKVARTHQWFAMCAQMQALEADIEWLAETGGLDWEKEGGEWFLIWPEAMTSFAGATPLECVRKARLAHEAVSSGETEIS